MIPVRQMTLFHLYLQVEGFWLCCQLEMQRYMHCHKEDSSFLFLDLKRIDSFAFSFCRLFSILLILILILCPSLFLLIHPVFVFSSGLFSSSSLFSLQQLLFSLSFGPFFSSLGSFNPQWSSLFFRCSSDLPACSLPGLCKQSRYLSVAATPSTVL